MGETTMSDEEAQVRTAHAAFIDAVNAVDLDCVLASMTDDAVFINPGQAPFGRDGFPEGFLRGHAEFELRCTSEIDEVIVSGDMAHVRCHDRLALKPRDGGADLAMAGHRSSLYRRGADGRWLLARDMHLLAQVDAEAAG